MAQQTEVVDDPRTGLVLYDTALFPTLLDQNPAEVEARFAARFAQAKTVDDLFDVLEGNSSKNMVGRKVQIDAVAWAPYESDQGIVPNAICTGVDLDTGELIEFATTSGFLTKFIRQAEIIKALPLKVRIEGKKTRSGRTALNFSRV